jgi:two-component system chemotaxis response regulator CheY
MMIRRIIANAAEVMGATCANARDGRDALDQLEKDATDIALICLDWNMPNMNGLEFLQAIKADARFARIPVLMVTTEGQQQSILTAIRAGAAGYLTKPFTAEDLQAKMVACLGLAT